MVCISLHVNTVKIELIYNFIVRANVAFGVTIVSIVYLPVLDLHVDKRIASMLGVEDVVVSRHQSQLLTRTILSRNFY